MDAFHAVAAVAGLAVGFAVAYMLVAQSKKSKASIEAARIIAEATASAEKNISQSRSDAAKVKDDAEKQIREERNELRQYENRLTKKEDVIDKRADDLQRREQSVDGRSKNVDRKENEISVKEREVTKIIEEEKSTLHRIAGLTKEDAVKLLLDKLEPELEKEKADLIRKRLATAQENAESEARRVISMAIQRFAASHTADSVVTVVDLPSDDMKGRIIGREGRNIRSFEVITGVDVIIDDTPEAVILSAFDPVRREIARLSLERLVADGRIHPARIEEVVAKVREEVERKILELGEMACLEVGAHGVHAELQRLMGRLHYRTSYGQNILRHSVEVAHLCGMMAVEIGMDQAMAKRCGLLHDIGKSIDHDQEGTHPALGMEVAARHGEPQPVLEAIGYHHDDYAGGSLWPVLVSAADAISGARPGARRESIEAYIKRLESLERIANSFQGVEKSYAIQAGREVRIMVEHHRIDDAKAQGLAGEIARRIEKELQYPGQIRVTVIRETRAVDYAK